MFTGIVEETGTVHSTRTTKTGIRLGVVAKRCGRGTRIGDSVAVNGCCLTVASMTKARGQAILYFDLLRETWDRTNLRGVQKSKAVNLERALAVNGRLGGHFVTGHIDGTGEIVRWERSGADHLLDIAAPPEVMRYIIFKGSVAVDGVSLTVAGVARKTFRIWIIPHTFAVTVLRERKVGDAVNLEADLLGKYAEKFVSKRT